MKSTYWFYIEPYVHISIEENNIILYNTLNHSLLEENQNNEILLLIQRIVNRENLYTCALNEEEFQSQTIKNFIEKIRSNFMGDIIPQSMVEGKPIQLPPDVKIMKKIRPSLLDNSGFTGHHLMENLTHLSLYINNFNNPSPDFPLTAYTQFLAPNFKGDIPQELNPTHIFGILNELQSGVPGIIDILGGDIFASSYLEELVQTLNTIPSKKKYHTHYLHISKISSYPNSLGNGENELHMMIHFPIQKEHFENAIQRLQKVGIPTKIHFIVSSIEEFEQADNIIKEYNLLGVVFNPYYTGDNMEFFEQTVFINREDLLEEGPSMKDILLRGQINPLSYGHITILSNGDIHTGLNDSPFGKLGSDSIHDVLFKAITNDCIWFKSRSQVSPCNKCVFRQLCPPVTSYEYAMNRHNLCHIFNNH